MPWRISRGPLAALALALAATATLGASVVAARLVDGDAVARQAGVGTAVVRVGADPPGRAVPRSFLGLSIEWDSVLPYTGAGGHRRTALLALLRSVGRAQRSPLALRIGGDSGDQAWWNPSGRPRPATIRQDVGPATMGAIAWLARGLGSPLTLGLNLALQDPANARQMVAAARRRLPPRLLAGLEIGNEPDLYRDARRFRRGGHLHVRLAKHPHYDVATYGFQTARYLRALTQPDAPQLVVGGFAGRGWWPALPGLLRVWGRAPGAVAAHLYAVNRCAQKTPATAWLMSAEASRGRVATLRPLLATARRAGLPLRVTELNSAACGGRARFSGTRAAALWMTDSLFALLRAGAAGADVHTWRGARYAPFAVAGARRVAALRPLAGMEAFARAAPAGSRLAATSVHGAASGLRAWATTDRAGRVRLALLAPRATRVSVPVARGTRCASVWTAGHARPAPCPPATAGRRLALSLGARSIAVMTLTR